MGNLNRKRKTLIALGIIFGIIFSTFGGYFLVRRTQGVKIKTVSNSELLYLDISGLTKFDDYINGSDWEIPTLDWNLGCTSFFAPSIDQGYIFGRNFDWKESMPMVVHIHNSAGYDSLSMVDSGFFTLTEKWQIKLLPASILLQSARMPMDGINEKGLIISGMYVPDMEMIDRLNIQNLFSVEIIRLGLDYAKTVNETISLWEKYDTIYPPGPPQHYLVADANGDSAVIEWYDGEMQVIRPNTTWQAATNFREYNRTEDLSGFCDRYDTVNNTLSNSINGISVEEAFELLQNTSMDITQWSSVYCTENKSLSLILHGNYQDIPFTFTI
ncbi:MAG: linear amide C-N hydrolase [Promethearchaeota archaeon]